LRTVKQFASINWWLSRYRTIFRRWLFPNMDPGSEVHLVDVGAGGCDIAVWALAEARRLGIHLRVTAVEADRRIVEYARALHQGVEGLTIQCMDARELRCLGRIDYLFANHFLHHLDDHAAVELLRVAGEVVRRVVVLGDLRRSRLSRVAFGLVASACYRRSFALRDGLLSIRKGFVEAELMGLARQAGLGERARVERLVPGRLVLRIVRGCSLDVGS
jgi:2-polyprenyl-3-methyl-5-hydroxy-6-metoxy-1,4-benzoquinol methylase